MSFKLGDRVILSNLSKGNVKFIGNVHFDNSIMVGIELDKAEGKCDGSIENQRYFTCLPNHGVFLPPSKIELFRDPNSGKSTKTKIDKSVDGFLQSLQDLIDGNEEDEALEKIDQLSQSNPLEKKEEKPKILEKKPQEKKFQNQDSVNAFLLSLEDLLEDSKINDDSNENNSKTKEINQQEDKTKKTESKNLTEKSKNESGLKIMNKLSQKTRKVKTVFRKPSQKFPIKTQTQTKTKTGITPKTRTKKEKRSPKVTVPSETSSRTKSKTIRKTSELMRGAKKTTAPKTKEAQSPPTVQKKPQLKSEQVISKIRAQREIKKQKDQQIEAENLKLKREIERLKKEMQQKKENKEPTNKTVDSKTTTENENQENSVKDEDKLQELAQQQKQKSEQEDDDKTEQSAEAENEADEDDLQLEDDEIQNMQELIESLTIDKENLEEQIDMMKMAFADKEYRIEELELELAGLKQEIEKAGETMPIMMTDSGAETTSMPTETQEKEKQQTSTPTDNEPKQTSTPTDNEPKQTSSPNDNESKQTSTPVDNDSKLQQVPSTPPQLRENSVPLSEFQKLVVKNQKLKEAILALQELRQQENSEAEARIEVLETENELIKDLQEEIDNLTEQLEIVVEENEEFKKVIDESRDNEMMIEDLSEKNLENEEKIIMLKNSLAEMEELKEISELLEQDQSAIITDLREEISQIEDDLVSANSRITELEKQLEQREEAIRQYQSLTQKLQKETDSLQQSHSIHEKQLEQVQDEKQTMESLRLKTLSVERNNSQLETELKLLNVKINDLNMQISLTEKVIPGDLLRTDTRAFETVRFISRLQTKRDLLVELLDKNFSPSDAVDAIFASDNLGAGDAFDEQSAAFAVKLENLLAILRYICDLYSLALSTDDLEKYTKLGSSLSEILYTEKIIDKLLELFTKLEIRPDYSLVSLSDSLSRMKQIIDIFLPDEQIPGWLQVLRLFHAIHSSNTNGALALSHVLRRYRSHLAECAKQTSNLDSSQHILPEQQQLIDSILSLIEFQSNINKSVRKILREGENSILPHTSSIQNLLDKCVSDTMKISRLFEEFAKIFDNEMDLLAPTQQIPEEVTKKFQDFITAFPNEDDDEDEDDEDDEDENDNNDNNDNNDENDKNDEKEIKKKTETEKLIDVSQRIVQNLNSLSNEFSRGEKTQAQTPKEQEEAWKVHAKKTREMFQEFERLQPQMQSLINENLELNRSLISKQEDLKNYELYKEMIESKLNHAIQKASFVDKLDRKIEKYKQQRSAYQEEIGSLEKQLIEIDQQNKKFRHIISKNPSLNPENQEILSDENANFVDSSVPSQDVAALKSALNHLRKKNSMLKAKAEILKLHSISFSSTNDYLLNQSKLPIDPRKKELQNMRNSLRDATAGLRVINLSSQHSVPHFQIQKNRLSSLFHKSNTLLSKLQNELISNQNSNDQKNTNLRLDFQNMNQNSQMILGSLKIPISDSSKMENLQNLKKQIFLDRTQLITIHRSIIEDSNLFSSQFKM